MAKSEKMLWGERPGKRLGIEAARWPFRVALDAHHRRTPRWPDPSPPLAGPRPIGGRVLTTFWKNLGRSRVNRLTCVDH